jgi:hypothetical protein
MAASGSEWAVSRARARRSRQSAENIFMEMRASYDLLQSLQIRERSFFLPTHRGAGLRFLIADECC